MPATQTAPATILDQIVANIHAARAAEPVSSPAARACAAAVLDLWNAPQVVRDYLLTAHATLRPEAARAAWAVANDYRSSGWQAHAAEAAASAIDGAPVCRVVSAAAVAMGAHAATQVLGRGTAAYDASRAAELAFRAEWEPRVRPRVAMQVAA